jgi:Arc/MetJ-type ribon-helix-helix transcriptional regulator
MPLTVRLSPKTERMLRALAKRRNASRSDVVREAIERYGASADADTGARAYDAWLDVIGIVELGARDTRRTTGEQFTALVRERTRARRAR